MKFKQGQLVKILGCTQTTETKWIDAINSACDKFSINTKLRLAAFIAQVGHESARLSAVTENLNYSADSLQKTWPSRFDATTAAAYARNPEKIANKVYGGRMGNGDEASGDGWKYRGRGLIQCTGKINYNAFSQACGVNAVAAPDSLAEPTNAALSAAWFWNSRGLNAYADRGDFLSITKRINGGTIGQAERERLYKTALIVLGDEEPPKTDEELDKTPVPPNPFVTDPVNEQKTPAAQNSSIVEPRAAFGSGSGQYPWNLVYESRSGHFWEMDDTPGAERVNMTHRTGSYWEITPDGTYTQKSVLDSYKLTKEDSYDYTGANHTGEVKGTFYQRVGGTATYKTGEFTLDAPRIQFNTGSLNVSGEINAPRVNAPLFSGHGGSLAFGEMVAKEAIVAYYIKKGKAPLFGGSLGFTGTPGVEGSADGAMTNSLAKQAPNGTPWITNGINPATVGTLTAVAAAAAVVAGLLTDNNADENVSRAMSSAADSLDAQEAAADAAQTPVFLKHVTFDKPTLLSMSSGLEVPDPSLYTNNLHVIVDSNGRGVLHQSDGTSWIPVGAEGAKNYTDQKFQEASDGILAETQARQEAILTESLIRQQAVLQEAQDRQNAIDQGLLNEAAARGAAVTAEANARQAEDLSLSDRIVVVTAGVNDNAAAIQQETNARVDAVSAEAAARQIVAARVDDNTAAISNETTARTSADSSITNQLNNFTSTTNQSIATVNQSIDTLTTAKNAQASQITDLAAKVDTNTASISNESTVRANETSSLTSQLNNFTATTNQNIATVNQNISTLTTAKDAQASQISDLIAKTDSTNAALSTEQNVRASAVDAVTSSVTTLRATTAANRGQSIFIENWEDANALDMWQEYLGGGEKTIVSVTDGKGGKALQIGDNLGNDQAWLIHKTLIPFDPNRTYRFKIDVKRVIAGGTLYIGWCGVAADGVTLLTISGLNSFSSQHYHVASGAAPNTFGTWNTYTGYTKGLSTGNGQSGPFNSLATPGQMQANVRYIRPLVVANYSQQSGTYQIGQILVEDASAELAQSDATKALSQLSDIANDNLLTKGEKPLVMKEYATLTAEETNLTNLGTTFNVLTERGDYSAVLGTLKTYITGLSPAYNDLTQDTVIIGSTFRANFQNVYIYRQNLLNAIDSKAKTLADQAQTDANTANAAIANIASDNVLSKGEKGDVILEYNTILAEQTTLDAQATTFGITTEKTAYDSKVTALTTYLNGLGASNAWSNTSIDTTIVGSAFRTAFQDVYTTRMSLLSAIDKKAKDLADAAQLSANTAQSDATKALNQLIDIANDDLLTKSEKPDLILEYSKLTNEQATLEAQGTTFSTTTEKTAYSNAINALKTYITGLTPAYNDLTTNTVIVGTTFRTKFTDVYTARQALLNAIDNKAKTLADQAQTDANTANAAIATISSDNILSKGEKSAIILEYNTILAEKTTLDSQADTFSITTEKTAYDTAVTDLTTYLNGLGSASTDWSNTALDTTIVGSTFRTNFQNVYNKKQLLLTALDTKAKSLADAAQVSANNALSAITNISSDNILSKGEKSAVILEYNTLTGEQSGLDSQATTFGVTTEKTAYDNAISALTTYLTGLGSTTTDWSNTTLDTTIVGSTFRTNFQNVYTARTALMSAIDTKAKGLADAAQTSANTANTAIANITSDNVLSKGEKSAIILEYNTIIADQTDLDAKATAFTIGTPKTNYDTAVTNLTTYLRSLGSTNTDWSNTSLDTTIVGTDFRTYFQDVYTKKQILVNALADAARTLAASKAKVTIGTTSPAGATSGDIWIDTSAGANKPVTKSWNGSIWMEADWRTAQNAADISTESTARTTGDNANATQITTLTTRIVNKEFAQFSAYFSWDFQSTLDGWTVAAGGSAVQNVDSIRLSAPSIERTTFPETPVVGAKNTIVRARIKRVSGTGWSGICYYSTAGHGYDLLHYNAVDLPATAEQTDWFIIEWDMNKLTEGTTDWVTNNITGIRLNFGTSNSDVFDIDWVAIGTKNSGVSRQDFGSVKVTATSTASDVGGIKNLYSVVLNSNGYASGFTMINNALPGGSGATSSFVVQADQFKLVPAASTAVSAAPFTVNTTTGKAVFQGSLAVASATTGARTEITDSVIKVYDTSGTLRVKLGDLS